MSSIPLYPVFAPFNESFYAELNPVFGSLTSGISELTFYSVLAHSVKYSYCITKTPENVYILSRRDKARMQFILLNGMASASVLSELVAKGWQLMLLNAVLAEKHHALLESCGISIEQDRDNADYVYDRIALVSLKGKALHKKKNHLNAFLSLYQPEVQLLSAENACDALSVLEAWHALHTEDADYEIAKQALQYVGRGAFWGIVVYIEQKCVGWAFGEFLCGGEMFCTHFEKGLDSVRGIYQFLNNELASRLPESVRYVNREQDLGDEGMRQAKMTYRPSFFVEKYKDKVFNPMIEY